MKSDEKKEWCIALGNINAYHDSILGTRFKFLKGELATKEKVFGMIPEMTEEEYAELFRPATEEEINGEFDWDGYQYILKKETKRMKSIKEKAEKHLNSVYTGYDDVLKELVKESYVSGANYVLEQIENSLQEFSNYEDSLIVSRIIEQLKEK